MEKYLKEKFSLTLDQSKTNQTLLHVLRNNNEHQNGTQNQDLNQIEKKNIRKKKRKQLDKSEKKANENNYSDKNKNRKEELDDGDISFFSKKQKTSTISSVDSSVTKQLKIFQKKFKFYQDIKKNEIQDNDEKPKTKKTHDQTTSSVDIRKNDTLNTTNTKPFSFDFSIYTKLDKKDLKEKEEEEEETLPSPKKAKEEKKDVTVNNNKKDFDWELEEFFQNKEKFDQFNFTEQIKQRISLICEQILISLSTNKNLKDILNLIIKGNKEINQFINEKKEKENQEEEEENNNNKEEESNERDWEFHLTSIEPKNHFPSLYVLKDNEKKEYEDLMKLRKKIEILPFHYRQIIYLEKGLELFTESKSNQLSQINWKNCGNYFLTCLSKLNPLLLEIFMRKSQFHHLCKSRIISFYKYCCCSCASSHPFFQKQFETAIASVKWYHIIQQPLSFLKQVNYLQYLLFDLWFLHLYQGKTLEFFLVDKNEVDQKKKTKNKQKKNKDNQATKIQTGILTERDSELFDEVCKRKYSGKKRPLYANNGSRLCIHLNEMDGDLLLENKEVHPPPYVFGILYPSFNHNNDLIKKEFFHLNVKSIPNTQNVLNEFFKNDIFFQDLVTKGLDKELYSILKEFPCEICLLITQYLRSIYYK